MPFTQPAQVPVETTPDIYSNTAADALLTLLLTHADQEAAKATFIGCYPLYEAVWDFRVQFSDRAQEHDRKRREQMAIARHEQDQQDKATIRDYEQKKLTEATEELANSFRNRCMSSEDLDGVEVPDPLIENFIDKSSLARIYGESNSYKSFITLDMAGCVAAGIKWHGNSVPKKAKTLYIVAEGYWGIKRRVRAWEKQYNQKFEAVIYPEAIQIDDSNAMRELIAFAKADGFEFIIFDTQARCTAGVDENSNTEMGRVVAHLDTLRKATNACVMLVHHMGKGKGNAKKDGARGASAIYAAMDAEFAVSSSDMLMRFETTKRKDGPEAAPVALRVVELTVEADRGGRAVQETSLAVVDADATGVLEPMRPGAAIKIPESQAKTLHALSKYRVEGASPQSIAIDLGMPAAKRNTIGKHLGEMAEKGLVKQVARRYVITEKGYDKLHHLGLMTDIWHESEDLDGEDC